ncbi:carbohydrate ABC transporter permease [Halorhabdus amylolytica]|uniref:carbohydrate ABC transporter permease n=1 Tax=Halorhabdus amylolytica TaxID=2559573 RepID=UPI0010AA5A50|nr:sugar ABC transporter permease [Halorhabdus amylolytica]
MVAEKYRRIIDESDIIKEYQYWLSSESVWGWVFLLPTIAAIGLVNVYPVIRAIYLSFTDYDGITEPTWIGLEHYIRIFTGWPEFWQVLQNTLVWVFGTVVVMLVLGMGFAVLLNHDFPGSGIATSLLLLPWVMPYIAVALNWQWMYRYQTGVFNGLLQLAGLERVLWLGSGKFALAAAMVGWIWRNFPFFMISFLSAMKAIPTELYEAALVDGSSRWELFRHITFPYLQPILIVTTLLMSLWTFNNFTMIFVLTGGGPGLSSMVLPVYVYRKAFITGDMGMAAAIGIVMMLIMLSYGLVYLRFYRADIGQK